MRPERQIQETKVKIIIQLFLFLFIGIHCFAQQQYSPRTFVKKSKKYIGTPYKLGGNDKKGIDCSGIFHNVFTELDVSFPRVSRQQAIIFKTIKLNRARKGDLVYFNTTGGRINHTGVIVKKRGRKKILFLHASSSQGVRIDNLLSNYWQSTFVKATRPLNYL